MSGPAAEQGPDAGWYPDPTGGPHPRWWDGIAWTNLVRSPDDGRPVADEHFRREDTGSRIVRVLLIIAAVVGGLLVLAAGACVALIVVVSGSY